MRQLHASDTPARDSTDQRPPTDAARQAAQQAGMAASMATRATVRSPWFAALARLGYAAKGVVYLVIGWLALLTAIRAGGKTTDPQGAITAIYHQPFGKALLVIIVVGFIGYALWQFLRAALNVDSESDPKKDTVMRIGFAIVGVTYLGFALAALRLLLRNAAPQGSNTSAQDWTARLLTAPFGQLLVILLGVIVLGVAVALFYQAWKRRFERYFAVGQMNSVERKIMQITGRYGIGALGAIFVVTGLFLIEAAVRHNAQQAQGIAGALATLAAQPFGPVLLGLVAVGLVAYGLFGWVEARYRRIGA